MPARERPRERLARRGVEALSEQELLALVLKHGRPGESALDVARSLLADYEDLAALASARPEELARRPGMGIAKASALVAAFRLGRLTNVGPEPTALRCARDVAAVAMVELGHLRVERVLVLICDAQNRLRQTEAVCDGTLDHACVSVRGILSSVLRHDGRAFAIAHNHPSGDPTPSEADKIATARVVEGAGAVGLRFLDHVIVAGGRWRAVAM